MAILKDVIRGKGARGFFYETRELLKLVRDTYAGGDATEMDVLRPVLDADLLVLDDLGAEKTSEWVQETLGLVVNTRYSERRPTIFTTNLVDSPNPDDLNSMIVPDRRADALAAVRDVRVGRDGRRRHPAGGRQSDARPTWRATTATRRSPSRIGGRAASPTSSRNGPGVAQGRGAADVNWAGGKGGSR